MNTFQTIDISALNTIIGGVVNGFGVVGKMPVVNRDVAQNVGVSKVGGVGVVPRVPGGVAGVAGVGVGGGVTPVVGNVV